MDVLRFENPALYLFMKISTAKTPSETVFSATKAQRLLSTSLMSG